MILRVSLCTDSSLSERETGIDCHTEMATIPVSFSFFVPDPLARKQKLKIIINFSKDCINFGVKCHDNYFNTSNNKLSCA